MPHSYHEQSKRLLTNLDEDEHLKIDDKKNEVLIHGKPYNLIDLIAYRNRLEPCDSHLYKFLYQIFQKFSLGISMF